MELTDNIHIRQFRSLVTPEHLREELPTTEDGARQVTQFRVAIQEILLGKSSRHLVIAGPCSLHDPKAALAYAERLRALQDRVRESLQIVMRAYVEKPRTTLGWKGMIYDPHLNHSYDIETGLREARRLFRTITDIGLPIATEFLDPIVPQYLADLVSWTGIGARTTESQIHRQMASGLSMPIGFKNGTDGNLYCAIDAIQAAASPHSFLGINRAGQVVVADTHGNPYGHLVMRGGAQGANYASEHVAFAEALLQKRSIQTRLIIDCSHANSNKDYRQQGPTCRDIGEQIRAGNTRIAGIMLESFLHEGKQSLTAPESLKYGVSITDGCIGWEETEPLIESFAAASTA